MKIYENYFKELWLEAVSVNPRLVALTELKDEAAIKSSDAIKLYLSRHSLRDSVKDLKNVEKSFKGSLISVFWLDLISALDYLCQKQR